jgi:hypothetical protein
MIALSNRAKGVYGTAFLALFLGGLVYVLWRPDTLPFFGWLEAVGLSEFVQWLRSYARPFYPHLPEWLVFSLPNGLWAFFYALIMMHLWWYRKSWMKYFWLGSIPIVATGYEFTQYLGIIPGIFCIKDFVFGIFGISLGIIAGALAGKKVKGDG